MEFFDNTVENSSTDWQSRFMELRNILKKYNGDLPVVLKVQDKLASINQSLWVSKDQLLLENIQKFNWLKATLKKV